MILTILGICVILGAFYAVFPLMDHMVYGPIREDCVELRRVIERDQISLNPLDPSILIVFDPDRLGLQPIEFIARNRGRIYKFLYPFHSTEYYVSRRNINFRLKDGTDLHKKLQEIHERLLDEKPKQQSLYTFGRDFYKGK